MKSLFDFFFYQISVFFLKTWKTQQMCKQQANKSKKSRFEKKKQAQEL